MSIREKFVEAFDEGLASHLEIAAHEHSNGVNSENKGSDPFRWVLLICIGYQCAEIDGYREYHGITAPWADIKKWIIDHGSLGEHEGDCDYLSMLGGAYNEYTSEPAPPPREPS